MGELGKPPEPLQIIGNRYRVECCIAGGAETSLVGAIDCATGKRVALKCWSGPTSEQEVAAVQCFIRSANVAGLFDNPHVVEVYGTELGDAVSYSVTEWLEGSTLAREVARLGRLPVQAALRHLLPCMRAVAEGHAAGIVHGDIRPAHVFLSRAKRHMPERARVFDFGRGSPGFHELRLPARAEVDEFCRYTPPELLAGGTLDARSDVYAFGLMIYEVITGDRVFVADDILDLLREIERGSPRVLEDVTQLLPNGLSEVLGRATAVQPERRHQELIDLLNELSSFALCGELAPEEGHKASELVVSQALGPTGRPVFASSRRLKSVGSGAAMVATALGLGYLAFDNGPNVPRAARPLTSRSAALQGEEPPKGTPVELVHDLIIPEPMQVAGPAPNTDQHTHVSPRRVRIRSERRRERTAGQRSSDTSALEQPVTPPAPAADAAAPEADAQTPLERMQLQ